MAGQFDQDDSTGSNFEQKIAHLMWLDEYLMEPLQGNRKKIIPRCALLGRFAWILAQQLGACRIREQIGFPTSDTYR